MAARKKTRGSKASGKNKKPTPEFALIVRELTRNPKASFASIKAKAEKKGLVIYPVSYGRAQLTLGIVKAKPRGQGKVAKQRANALGSSTPKRGPGRPRKVTGRGPGRPRKLAAEEDFLQAARAVQARVAELEAKIEKIRQILG